MTDMKIATKSFAVLAEELRKFRRRKLTSKEIEEINLLIEEPKERSKKNGKQSAHLLETEA